MPRVRNVMMRRSWKRRSRPEVSRWTLARWEVVAGFIILTAAVIYLPITSPTLDTRGHEEIKEGETLTLHTNFAYSYRSYSTFVLSWSSASAVRVSLEFCAKDAGCGDPDLGIIAYGNGTSGTFSFDANEGDFYGFVSSGLTNVTFSGSTFLPFFYLSLPVAAVGSVLLLIGGLANPLNRTRRARSRMAYLRERARLPSFELLSLVSKLGDSNLVVAFHCPECGASRSVSARIPPSRILVCPTCQRAQEERPLVELLRKSLES